MIRAILLTIIALVALRPGDSAKLLIWTLGDWSRNFGIANWIGNEFVGVFYFGCGDILRWRSWRYRNVGSHRPFRR